MQELLSGPNVYDDGLPGLLCCPWPDEGSRAAEFRVERCERSRWASSWRTSPARTGGRPEEPPALDLPGLTVRVIMTVPESCRSYAGTVIALWNRPLGKGCMWHGAGEWAAGASGVSDLDARASVPE
jgi:hypothetical protein